ncbi:MAG: hypothetical protein IKP64_04345 [Selenomonadaceae bacterium]|nr:hypothetical protein [Selenomonadaceae bacterium]
MMTLTETIPMMTSDDYRERFKAEYYQLKIRASKLQSIIQHDMDLANSPKIILERQINAMLDYLSTLALRAEFEGIDLQED